MTLHPQNYWEVPAETVRVARASFPKGNIYMKMYDELGTLYKDKDFVDVFPVRCGQSAISPARLALITICIYRGTIVMEKKRKNGITCQLNLD